MPPFNMIVSSRQKRRVKIFFKPFQWWHYTWHLVGHLRRGIVIKVAAKRRVASDGAFLGALSFRVPKGSVPINRELIPRKYISLSFLLRSCLSSPICSAFLTSRHRLLLSCYNTFSSAIFQLPFLDTCGSSSPLTESIF